MQDLGRRSPYDPDPGPEEDLWFLPGAPEDMAPTDPPWRMAPVAPRLDVAAWRAAEASQYHALLGAAEAVARFAERLRAAPPGAAERVALVCIVALMRGEGTWLAAEEIVLYRHLRLSGGDATRDLARADWAWRRLSRPRPPQEGLHGFLGRVEVSEPATEGLIGHSVGAELLDLGQAWAGALEQARPMHPITRAALGLAEWHRLDVSPVEDRLEPLVAAMLVGAGRHAPFLPLGQGVRITLAGDPERRLAEFCAAVEAGALEALMLLDRLAEWQAQAVAATADLSGRVPGHLIAALLAHPVLSAEAAAVIAGCSRAASRRNLLLFANRGLVRETTGQARYRFWSARI